MSARRNRSGLANPVLIGALTVLVVIVAVFLAYNANNGLPFVPSYTLHVQVADASELTHGAEVHMGGALVGFVDSVAARARAVGPADRRARAEAQQEHRAAAGQLDVRDPAEGRDRPEVPRDQPRALEADVPERRDRAARARRAPPSTSTRCCRCSARRRAQGVVASTVGFSDGLAGRGIGINDAIGAFVPLLGDLGPVARNLASPHTDLGGFLHGLEALAGTLAPVAHTQAALFVNLDTTFRALASVSVPYLQDAISRHAADVQRRDRRQPRRSGRS